MTEVLMRPRWAVLVLLVSAALTWGVAALLTNVAERKAEGKVLEACPCPSESCPHHSRGVK